MKSELMFYEISSTGQKEVNEESKEKADVGEEEGDKNAINEGKRWWLYTLLSAGGLIVFGIVFFFIREHVWVIRGEKKFKRMA